MELRIAKSYLSQGIIAKSYLSQGIQIVSKAVPSKTTMSILECILIDASGSDIRLIANDMELGIETKVSGLIISRGIIAGNFLMMM